MSKENMKIIKKLLSIEECTELQFIDILKNIHKLLQFRNSMSEEEFLAEGVVRETFDRPVPYNLAHCDLCMGGLQSYMGVRTWLTLRKEHDLNGNEQKLRLLTIFGLRNDVFIAYWLYLLIDTVIVTEAKEFSTKHMFRINPSNIKAFRHSVAQRLNEQLKSYNIAALHVRDKLMDEMFSQLKLRITGTGGTTQISIATTQEGIAKRAVP